MGCGSSTEKKDEVEKQNSTEHVGKIVNVRASNSNGNEGINTTKTNNFESNINRKSEGEFIISPQESSLEVLIPKKDRPTVGVVAKRNCTKSQRKSKELKQVVAWGKKTSTTETNFLEDLRTQRRQSNPFYEQEYETNEVDETARFIESGQLDMDESSLSGLSDSSQILKIFKQGDQEESFDVSKIIDVEKFRAANVGERKKADKDNEMDLNLNTKSSGQVQRLDRSPTQDTREEGLNELYNEDDKHLIESIEKEFLVTQDNFLPGQIVN